MTDNQIFLEYLQKQNYSLSPIQTKQFEKYCLFLQQESQKMNLTAIKETLDIYIKHFCDCLELAKFIPTSVETILDVGTGAGFPGVVIAIYCPDKKITLLEPTEKKVQFLTRLIEQLEIKNVTILQNRAECEIVNQREAFDFVCARAVAPLSTLLELLVPFVKVQGYVCCMKGANYQEELDSAKNALIKLKMPELKVKEYILPEDCGKRAFLYGIKNKNTPKEYPRMYSKMKKNPL